MSAPRDRAGDRPDDGRPASLGDQLAEQLGSWRNRALAHPGDCPGCVWCRVADLVAAAPADAPARVGAGLDALGGAADAAVRFLDTVIGDLLARAGQGEGARADSEPASGSAASPPYTTIDID